jgi:general secretion pathway protein A
LRMVGAAFGVRVKDLPKSELLMTLEAFFVNQTSQGKRCLLIVDEAQNLTARAVEELRMLSNFQFGNQSLLQTFLVGQPEFRNILQRPEMEQFRQRVAATCHIGPLDEDETQRYIEHRLKCAGSSGKPSFDLEVFPQLYKASQGIPRRINSLCDRLLLLGFMAGKSHLEVADIVEVMRDLAQESAVSLNSVRHGFNGAALDVDLTKLKQGDLSGLSGELAALSEDQQSERLQRLETSLMRLERINLQTLGLLQKLVEAVRPSPATTETKP